MMASWHSNLRGDAVGGIVSATVAVPLAMGYGMFAFVALGGNYFASGALAGLYTAFMVAVVCVLLGDKSTTVYAPRINTTFFLGLLIYGLVNSELPAIKSGGTSLILAMTFSIVFLGGLFEALFGLIRLGSLIKFAPQPVMAGFQNAAAILLFLVQLGNVCGFDYNVAFTQVAHHADSIKPLSVLIAAVTFLATWHARKLPGRIPPVITGIAVGTGLYYLFKSIGLGAYLGPVIESEPLAGIGLNAFPYFGELARVDNLLVIAPTIVAGALALAVIASLDALLCAKLVTPLGERTADGDRLLLRLGTGNVVASCFGGITSGLNIGPSIANRTFGGRTPFAVVVHAITILIVCTVLFPVAAMIPRVALSAVIMVIAIQHLDIWSLRLVRRLAVRTASIRRHALLDFTVIVLVAIVSVTLDIVLAVFIGIAIAVLLFVVNMSRSVVRRSYRCGAARSRRSRTADDLLLLGRRGEAILVMELQGALFFGTGERLVEEINDALAHETAYVVLDLRRINEIDSTGARALLEINAILAARQKTLLLVIGGQSLALSRLRDFELVEALPADCVFTDVDRAIERAEDELLRDRHVPASAELPLAEIGVLMNLSEFQVATIAPRLIRLEKEKGDVIFQEGEPGRDLLMITKGRASAHLRLPGGDQVRLATFGPGTIFGELALLDDGLRSATVVADDHLICYSLSKDAFAALAAESPAVAIKLLASLGRELSSRLRVANRTIQQLEL
jgi:MFS superfamily sulfate permease-like transporter